MVALGIQSKLEELNVANLGEFNIQMKNFQAFTNIYSKKCKRINSRNFFLLSQLWNYETKKKL